MNCRDRIATTRLQRHERATFYQSRRTLPCNCSNTGETCEYARVDSPRQIHPDKVVASYLGLVGDTNVGAVSNLVRHETSTSTGGNRHDGNQRIRRGITQPILLKRLFGHGYRSALGARGETNIRSKEAVRHC